MCKCFLWNAEIASSAKFMVNGFHGKHFQWVLKIHVWCSVDSMEWTNVLCLLQKLSMKKNKVLVNCAARFALFLFRVLPFDIFNGSYRNTIFKLVVLFTSWNAPFWNSSLWSKWPSFDFYSSWSHRTTCNFLGRSIANPDSTPHCSSPESWHNLWCSSKLCDLMKALQHAMFSVMITFNTHQSV